MSEQALDLQARIEQLEEMLEKSNAEKQECKQMAHKLANVLNKEKDTGNYHLPETDNILKEFGEFKNLKS